MDCCNYGQYGAGGAWEGYGAGGYVPPPYTPYAPYAPYAPHAHDPYARYYRYDYSQNVNMHHTEHAVPIDYGAYAVKEVRARRSLARRERTHTPAQHLPLPPTPPLEIGMNGRGPTYGEPQMWSHYQMGALNGGWSGGHAVNGGWGSRGPCSREHMRYPTECRPIKGPQMPPQNAMCQQNGRSTPYPVFEEANYSRSSTPRHAKSTEFTRAPTPQETPRVPREQFYPTPQRSPPEEKRPPVVPLPAFQQAFGSTEIGKFAEAFSRTEVVQDEAASDGYLFDSFPEWEGPAEPWTAPPARDIKCEDNY